MRALVTIPHFFGSGGSGAPHGSGLGQAAHRAAQVGRCIAALHGSLGPRQAVAGGPDIVANAGLSGAVDVVLVTTPTDHLVDHLPPHLFTHAVAQAEPRHLGFVCHNILKRNAGAYDWLAYLEDDIEIADPLFLLKLDWFQDQFGNEALLQPNRFELSDGPEVAKLYIDGPTTQPDIPARFQDRTVAPRLEARAFGRDFVFQRVENAHSGCFFLRAGQLARAAAAPAFGQPTAAFFGPLESAATLPVMQAFRVYKPARENAGFLEVRHLGQRMLPAEEGAG